MELKIKEISKFSDCGQNKTKMVFCDENCEKEIIFNGEGELKTPVVEV